ncbi:MAG: murein biosynthesis integral membrane protein MurJ [Gemmatimonadota bacterium]
MSNESRRGSFFVAAGILLSRCFGLIRQTLLAHYLGLSDAADALNTAFRIPNFLQNLLGEGALSASFIPSYSRLLGDGDEEEARRLAGALLSVMLLAVAIIVLAGELATPSIMSLLVSHQWPAEKRALTARLVQILFPGAGIMVFSAWCLGVLNSHRKFLLSYASPVVWNLTIIAAIILFGRHAGGGDRLDRFVVITAYGAVAGSLLQVLVQLPAVMRVGGRIVPMAWNRARELPHVVRAFVPNVISRGANQISALVDLYIASSIPMVGAVAAIANAQVLYTLPVSLFGMAVSAAELPEMARERGDAATIATALRLRLSGATQRLAFYIVPSALGFLTLGGVIAAAMFQTGRFKHPDSNFVWIVLAGSATGLLASTLGRLYASTFYALDDTRTPLYCGIVRVLLTGILGWIAAILLPPALGLEAKWGAAGLTATAGIAGWVEFSLLRRALCHRLGHFSLEGGEQLKLWIAGLAAAVVGTIIRLAGAELHPIVLALLAVPANAITYLVITSWWDIPEAAVLTSRIRRVLRGEFRPA